MAGRVSSLVEQFHRRALRIARRAELAAFETVESPFGGEKAESAFAGCDDSGRSVPDFNYVGFGHDCSFAEVPALLSDL
jgi:hypothetical protein